MADIIIGIIIFAVAVCAGCAVIKRKGKCSCCGGCAGCEKNQKNIK